MKKPFVFISYSSKDETVADRVQNYLEGKGIRCWIASEDIGGGESYAVQIVDAINDCDVFLLIASPNSNISNHVSNELSLAFSAKKKIIPFRVSDFVLSKANVYFLQQAQWIDAFGNMTEALERLLEAVRMEIPKVSEKPKAPGAPHMSGTQLFMKDNTLYEGAVFAGVPHGNGKARYSNGDVYEGSWSQGKRHGQGKLTWNEGGTFTGEFRDDAVWSGIGVVYEKRQGLWLRYEGYYESGKRNGYGKLYYTDCMYEGQWKDGVRHGRGKLIWNKGGEWVGEFRDDKRWTGDGKYYYTDCVYIGQWKDGVRHGRGKLIWNEGGEWVGEFRDDKRWSGSGKYIFTDAVYIGQWKDGKRHGQGRMIWNKGGEFSGEFREDEYWSGKGVVYEKASDGFSIRYEGEYKFGKRNGYGKCVYKDSVYEGQWLGGVFNGQGKLTWNKGGAFVGEFYKDKMWTGKGVVYTTLDGFSLRYEGEYKSGQRNGHGKIVYEDSVYEGEWLSGKKHGQGKLTWNEGGAFVGTFREDKKWSGSGKIVYADAVYEGQFKDGKRSGQGKMIWNKGGEYTGTFKDGSPWNGKGTWYFSNGKYTGRFVLGKQLG